MEEFFSHPLTVASLALVGLAIVAFGAALLSAWRDSNPRVTIRRRESEDSTSQVLADS
jgi:hypothetical protein